MLWKAPYQLRGFFLPAPNRRWLRPGENRNTQWVAGAGAWA